MLKLNLKSVIGCEVTHAQFHSGVAHIPRTGYNKERDGVEMVIVDGCMLAVKLKDKRHILVGSGNILWAEFIPLGEVEEELAADIFTAEPKRRGRPPKALTA